MSNLISAVVEGQRNAAKIVARDMGLKYNGTYICSVCMDPVDNKGDLCSNCQGWEDSWVDEFTPRDSIYDG